MIIVLIYHCHKLLDLIYQVQYCSNYFCIITCCRNITNENVVDLSLEIIQCNDTWRFSTGQAHSPYTETDCRCSLTQVSKHSHSVCVWRMLPFHLWSSAVLPDSDISHPIDSYQNLNCCDMIHCCYHSWHLQRLNYC